MVERLMASRTWEHGKGRYHLVGELYEAERWQDRYHKPLCGSPCTLDGKHNNPVPAETVAAGDRCTRCVKLGWPGDEATAAASVTSSEWRIF